jgi:streptomycin 3"-adenylyltransferase
VIPPQAQLVAGELEQCLGADLVGLYLHGSAALGELGRWSDLDLVAIVCRPLDTNASGRITEVLLASSVGYERTGSARPIELDVVLPSAFEPWRRRTPVELHYDESLRTAIERGDLTPWDGDSDDMAANAPTLLAAGIALVGPPVQEVVPAIPDAVFRQAVLEPLDWSLPGDIAAIPGAIRNHVLTLPRTWATLATHEPHSKLRGAEWALPRLPADLSSVLDHARSLHTGVETAERWDDLPLLDYERHLKAQIEHVALEN